MKRLLSLLITVVLTIQLSACAKTPEPEAINPTEEKISQIEEIIAAQQKNSMGQVYQLAPDLKLIRTTAPDDDFNISQASYEDWLYSREEKLTVIMWNDQNAPLHVFVGNALSQEKVPEIREKRQVLFD